ncbi:hypothetical protein C8R46DRAFT_1032732 [Mycena filopes]|nr:hypothetical protein C8R46DRAFT_1032732 [Mycena filopes]
MSAIVLPMDVFWEIVNIIARPGEPYDPDSILRMRGVLRCLSRNIKVFVDSSPIFWTHVVATPLVRDIALKTNLERMAGLPFSLTLRVEDLLQFGDARSIVSHQYAERFVRGVVEAVSPYMHQCTDLVVRAADPATAAIFLKNLSVVDGASLRSLTFAFGLFDFEDFRIPELAAFRFAGTALFAPVFGAITELTVTVCSASCPAITYTSGSQYSALVSQPRGDPLYLAEFLDMLVLSDQLSKLVIVGVDLRNPIDLGTYPTLFALTTIQVEFRGNHALADARRSKSGRIAPRFQETCRFGVAPHIVLSGVCPSPGLAALFSLMQSATSVDMREAAAAFFNSFASACDSRSSQYQPFRNACPSLKFLKLPPSHPDSVKRMLVDRLRAGYTQIEGIVILGESDSWDGSEAVIWMRARGVNTMFQPHLTI